MSHTPVPWRVGDAGRTVFGPPQGIPPLVVADVRDRRDSHLIAASPDGFALIDTLNAILTQFPDGRHVNWPSIKADCEAYLRKAKGE